MQQDLFGKIAKKPVGNYPGSYLFFDTETTGLPRNWSLPVTDLANWPRLVQLAWVLYKDGLEIDSKEYIIKPEGFVIPDDVLKVHGISNEKAHSEGVLLKGVLDEFAGLVAGADYLVAHNMSFDEMIVGAEFLRKNMSNHLDNKNKICTKEISTNFCAIPSNSSYKEFKWPKLSELHIKLFGKDFAAAHNAFVDVKATAKCFFELKNRGIV